MERSRFERLVEVMGAMAAGDPSAVFMLLEEFGSHVRGAMRRHLVHLHHEPDPTLLSDLTVDGCIALYECASGWDPSKGALPWNWAGRRLLAVASAAVGQRCRELDFERLATAEAGETVTVAFSDPDEAQTLHELARRMPAVGLLAEAFDTVASARDQQILLAYEALKAEGDPSPANTLATRFGLTPVNVRQIVRRTKQKLRQVAGSERRFAALAELQLLAS